MRAFALAATLAPLARAEYYNYPVKSINLDAAAAIDSYVAHGTPDALEPAEDMHAVHGIELAGGGFALVGKALESEDGEHSEAFAVALDAAGAVAWAWASGSGGDDAANSVAQLPDGGDLLVAGWRTVGGVGRRCVVRLDAATGAEVSVDTDFGDAAGSHGAWESVEVAGERVVLAGLRAKPSLEEMFFKSYGNVWEGTATVSAYDAAALATPLWTRDVDFEDDGERYNTAKAARVRGTTVAVLLYGEDRSQAAVATLDMEKGEVGWGPEAYDDHGEATDLQWSADGAVLALSGHGGDESDGLATISARLTSVDAASGAKRWTKEFSVGGTPTMIYNECWGLAARSDGGFAVSCGCGIEGNAVCRQHSGDAKTDCLAGRADDRDGAYAVPPGTWLSYVFRVDASGDLLWQRVDSYRDADDGDDRDDPDWEPSTSAAEWVVATADGGLAVITDEMMGVGVYTLSGGDGGGDGDACADSDAWFFKKAKKGCDWVAKRASQRCKKKAKVAAADACAASCGNGAGADSATWYAKKTAKTCAWVAAQTSKRCAKAGKDPAAAACAATCDAC